MCGICGLADWGSECPVDPGIIERMVGLLGHRGPDGLCVFTDTSIGLGHARLSIIDLAGGAQPMANEDESLWIVFNGEVFNYVELRPGLERQGHRFATHSDTEVVLHLYEEYGAECVDYLNGQFAIAIWDRRHRKLFLARDRLGIRPLFYAWDGRRLLFASEIKSFLAVPEVSLRLDPLALDQTFTFWSPLAPRTAFEHIFQLPPAHHLTLTAETATLQRYWDIPYPDDGSLEPQPESYYVQRLRDELIQATRLRMRADVPVGGYLSGGLDSSLTAALVTGQTDTALDTFSVRFQEPAYDEGEQQALMIGHLGTDHHSVMVSGEDIARAFAEVIWHAETPILRTAPVPLHYLSRLVRAHGIKVVVTGEGADEVLAGYNIFKEAKLRRMWAAYPDSPLAPLLLTRLYPYIRQQRSGASDALWRQSFARSLHETSHPCYSHLIRWRNTAALKRLFTPELRARIGAYDSVQEYAATLPAGFGRWHPLSQAQYIETTTFMANYLLSSQGDRVGMSHGIEGRFPFLDYHVVEFAAQIPPKYKLRALEEKHILREMAREYLPEPVRLRAKQPYRAPDSAPFFTRMAIGETRELLSTEALQESGIFEPQAVARFLEKCGQGGAASMTPREDMALVGMLSTQLLYRQFVKEARRQSPGARRTVRRVTPSRSLDAGPAVRGAMS